MSDHEEAPSLATESILTAEEIEEIKRWAARVYARERRARRRRAPPWNPDTDSPWLSLEHCFIAALKGCNEISTRDLETVLARGKVWMTGTRDDAIGDFLPDRIETLVAAGERRVFYFDSNSIWATYKEPPRRVALRSMITFSDVRVHWPMLVEALEEAGFEITVAPRQARTSQRPRGTVQDPPRPAPEAKIHEAIQGVYHETKAAKKKPPNVNEVIKPAQARLAADGYEASGRQIRRLAGEPRYAAQRWKPGKTNANAK